MVSITRHGQGPRFSRVVVHNGVAYFSGLTADIRDGKIEAQTQEILEKADDLLCQIGATRSEILSATIWLREIEDFAGMNAAWEAWVGQHDLPARATVESTLAADDIRVEIQFIVAVD